MHDRVTWRTALRELAAIRRPSASEGERRAAELISGWLRERGCRVEIEREHVHGGYWWPVGLPNALTAAAGAVALRSSARAGRRARVVAAAVAGVSAALLWDDLGHGRRPLRRLLPRRPTWNVLAWAGDPVAERTVVLIAHHDAAHSGLVFHPALGRIGPAIAPSMHARATHTFPILFAVWLGPVTAFVGAVTGSRAVTRAGALLSAGAAAAMADIGRSPDVPGANDNLSAVGALIAVAERLALQPLQGVRVLLLSTGSEESFSEGMQAFGARHFAELDRERTEFLCLECLGGETLIVLEGEGMLRMRDYPAPMREALAAAAAGAGVPVARGLRTVAATDALIALRAGYPVVTLASIDPTKLPRNYHWASDTPDGLCWETIEAAIATCDSFLRACARRASLNGSAPGDTFTSWDATASSSTSGPSARPSC